MSIMTTIRQQLYLKDNGFLSDFNSQIYFSNTNLATEKMVMFKMTGTFLELYWKIGEVEKVRFFHSSRLFVKTLKLS